MKTCSVCVWCHKPKPDTMRADARFCSARCRVNSFRFSVGVAGRAATDRPLRFAYADPPYPGHASLYPEKTEVDHGQLVARLIREYPDGWALSTCASAARWVWNLCPLARQCVWVKTPRKVRSTRPLSAYEVVFVSGGRSFNPTEVATVSDALVGTGFFRAFPGALIGMKPPRFSEWVFQLLGARRGDSLDDLFPGSGAVSEAWRRYTGEYVVAMKEAVPGDRGT